MANVHVVFTEKGAVEDVIAMPELAPAVHEDMIFWNIRSEHDHIDEVEICFEDPEATFFEYREGKDIVVSNSFRKRLRERADGSKAKGNPNRRWTKYIQIFGQAPVQEDDVKSNKYWIKGYKDNVAKPIAELDPEIITTRPRR